MAKRVFFSFHYERDIFRANVVRNSWVTHKDRESAGFWDAGIWEEAKTKGQAALEKLIRDGLHNTSVTAVLIGAETYTRNWVDFEIRESWNRGNGLIGIRIHHIRDIAGQTDTFGPSPFNIELKNGKNMGSFVPIYDWILDDGYNNIGTWVDGAPTMASAG